MNFGAKVTRAPLFIPRIHEHLILPHAAVPSLPDSQRVVHALQAIVCSRSHEPDEDSFFVADMASVRRQLTLWNQLLPGIEPHYAVKCNSDPMVLRNLALGGAGFDCASESEIRSVLEVAPKSSIVFANTIKTPSHLRYARANDVRLMTFDNDDELVKIARWCPNSELLLRISTDDEGATCRLSNKFGALPSDCRRLLLNASRLGLNVVGVAFHIGSGGGTRGAAYLSALKDARQVFSDAVELGLPAMRVLDIGGGFEPDIEDFTTAAEHIRSGIENLKFPPGTRIIAEPGRFFVANAYTLCTHVIGRRKSTDRDMLYVTDGVYGNLNCIVYDHQSPVPQLLRVADDDLTIENSIEASVWGPTCDGIDLISDSTIFPRRVEIGDWLYFENLGAYSLAASTTFNGYGINTEVFYLNTDQSIETI